MANTQRAAAREKVREITERMRTDPGFVQQLRDDPRGALAAAGMPADVLDEAVADLDLGLEGDVIGHGGMMRTMWTKKTPAPEAN